MIFALTIEIEPKIYSKIYLQKSNRGADLGFSQGVEVFMHLVLFQVLSAFDAVLVKFSGDDIPDYILSEISEELGGDTRAIVGHVRLESKPNSPFIF